jgi:hypothetical protein
MPDAAVGAETSQILMPGGGVATLLGAAEKALGQPGSGYEQTKAKLRCIESDEVAVAFGPPA